MASLGRGRVAAYLPIRPVRGESSATDPADQISSGLHFAGLLQGCPKIIISAGCLVVGPRVSPYNFYGSNFSHFIFLLPPAPGCGPLPLACGIIIDAAVPFVNPPFAIFAKNFGPRSPAPPPTLYSKSKIPPATALPPIVAGFFIFYYPLIIHGLPRHFANPIIFCPDPRCAAIY